MSTQPAVVLTIGGSDSSGGAGVQADLRAFGAFGVLGTTAFTVVTAQNTSAIQGAHVIPASFVGTQIDAVRHDLDIRAVKTGMLGRPEVIGVVTDRVRHGLGPLVVDSVLVTGTGQRLFDDATTDAYLSHLIPTATVLTANRDEAALLCGEPLDSVRDLHRAAASLAALGPTMVLITGGRLGGTRSTDVMWFEGETVELSAGRVVTTNTRGTGDTLSAGICAGLADGEPPDVAARKAKAFITGALAGSAEWRVGAGTGPLDASWRQSKSLEP